MKEKFLKSLFYEKKGLIEKASCVLMNPRSVMLSIFDTFFHNTGALVYGIGHKNLGEYYKEYFDLIPGNNKQV